jgi:hypothetical protein
VSDLEVETVLAALTAEARRRFGADRANALAPELGALARDLALVARTPLPPDVEPGAPPDDEGGDPSPPE